MNFQEFDKTINQLKFAYGKQIADDQMQFWFEKFEKWSAFKFEKAIGLCIEENDRFPSIAAIVKKGYEITDPTLFARQAVDCHACRSNGVVSALLEKYQHTFRCGSCSNWQGRFSESIPLWSQLFKIQGYVPQ